jgi:hypothetical protein
VSSFHFYRHGLDTDANDQHSAKERHPTQPTRWSQGFGARYTTLKAVSSNEGLARTDWGIVDLFILIELTRPGDLIINLKELSAH